jgi:CheY-like chemotaxis protein
VFEVSGFRVVTAANGEEAVKVFTAQRSSVRLVVTDVMMPVMDGLTLARALHALEPALPIIACSGLDQQDRRAEFARHGVVAILNKPLAVATLLDAVNRALQTVAVPRPPDSGRL